MPEPGTRAAASGRWTPGPNSDRARDSSARPVPRWSGTGPFSSMWGAKGAGVVAFDADTGRTLWKATDDEAGYSSPVHASIGGKPRIISFTRNGVVTLDPASGRVGFRVRWRSRSRASVNAAAPLIVGDQIFVSASYSTGALLLGRRRRVARKDLDLRRRPQQPLRHQRLPGRLSLRFSRPPGIRSQPALRRVADRKGRVEPGRPRRRDRHSGRRPAVDPDRAGRIDPGRSRSRGFPGDLARQVSGRQRCVPIRPWREAASTPETRRRWSLST